jgi:AcrR family transcriptional regulator
MRMNTHSRPAARPRVVLRGEIAGVYRRAILDAAERVLAARGLAEAKMADIAKAAGLAAGTLYNYFESKEEIVHALIEQRGDELLANMEALAARPGSLRDVLERLVRGALDHFDTHRPLFAVFAQIGAGSDAAGARGSCGERCMQRYLALFEDLFRRAAKNQELKRGLPPRDLAVLFTASVHGFLRTWMLERAERRERAKDRIADRAPFIVNVFLAGAAP